MAALPFTVGFGNGVGQRSAYDLPSAVTSFAKGRVPPLDSATRASPETVLGCNIPFPLNEGGVNRHPGIALAHPDRARSDLGAVRMTVHKRVRDAGLGRLRGDFDLLDLFDRLLEAAAPA
ncbi:hypothetical protein ACIBI9_65210 [Nonomuraea sp. NPDC050451]|uniref:hypothetical protein n=1 Tax=Nonomuraea sp. NPDC050451 TaxID=3364364 RepID=UPI0037BA37DC